MDFHSLKRKDLQSLCKKNKIPANMTNKSMADALSSLKSIKRKAEFDKAPERKKSMSKACQVTESTQEKESIAHSVESQNMKGRLGMLPDITSEKVLTPLLNLDIFFMILSLLPTEAVLRMKSVCRAWADIIADSAFSHAHCTGPAPITSFFSIQYSSELPHDVLIPLQKSPKFPSMITAFLSSGFEAASTSHGLVCFQREKDETIIVANPATSHWTLIPRRACLSLSLYDFPVIIYDPSVSLHFTLTIAAFHFSGEMRVKFHMYSSDTSSWAVSRRFASPRFPTEGNTSQCLPSVMDGLVGSKIGGGSVCWEGRRNNLIGYEIASNTFWMTPLPLSAIEKNRQYASYKLLARDGEIYCAIFCCRDSKTFKVERLDEAKTWVLEGEAKSEKFENLEPSFLTYGDASYDIARKALILGIDRLILAFSVLSPRFEVLGQDNHASRYPSKLPHANTLAHFHGGKPDVDALHKLLCAHADQKTP